MQRWNGIDEVPAGFGPSVVTIGNFDGVHRGHQAVLNRLVARARALGARAAAITFEPHPLAVLYPEHAPAVLTGPAERLALLAGTGLDGVLVMEFTRELAAWSPRRFVKDVIVDVLAAQVVVVGPDTRFGHRNSGDVGTLRELGAEFGFAVEVQHDLGQHGESGTGERRWSSSWVRELLAAGEVEAAAEVLGRPHRVTGVVVHGDHRGRALGFPTANLAQDSVGLIPADGVYAGWLLRVESAGRGPGAGGGRGRLPAAISVGTNPTFDGHQRRVEAYVLDRDDLELYGDTVAVEFVRRLRPTLRFEGVQELIAQMAGDVEQCHQVLGVPSPTV